MTRLPIIRAALAALCVCAATQAVPSADASVPAPARVFVGFTEDLPKETAAAAVGPARELGAKAFRLTLGWDPGQRTLAAADAAKLDRAVGAATGMRVVLAVYADLAAEAPQTDAQRSDYCAYVAHVLGRYPAIRDVAIWNEPNSNTFWQPRAGAAAAYGALAARCWDVLHAARADVNVVGPVLAPNGFDDGRSDSPGQFIRDLGTAYRASGRTRPLFDTIAHHAYGNGEGDRPWHRHVQTKWISQGDWNKLMYNLWLAFDGTAQPIPGEEGTTIWYLEAGYQTAVDEAHRAAYRDAETEPTVIPDDAGGDPAGPPPAETSTAPDQLTQVLDGIRLAYCQPHVEAFFNFLLVDEPTLRGWQSGAFWADGARKDSYPGFQQAIAEVNAGSVDCAALKGGRPSADFMPPGVPGGLEGRGESGPVRVVLSWTAAADDASPVSYRVYRNGAHVGTTGETTWTHTDVAAETTYTYTVRALDSAGNLGNASSPVSVTTPADAPPPVGGGGGGGGGSGAPPDLVTTVTSAASAVRAGDSVPVTVVVANKPGAGFAQGVKVGLELSANATVALAESDRGPGCAGAPLSCDLDFLGPPGTVRLVLAVTGAGPLVVAATAQTPSEAAPADNRASLTVPEAPAPPAAAPVGRPASSPTVKRGNGRANVLRGTAGADVLLGLGGRDRLFGLAGRDVLRGGTGPDVLAGGTGADVLEGGPGADRLLAADRVRDTIRCGSGLDSVVADRLDRVSRDCERVRRAR